MRNKIKEHWNNHKEKYLIGATALSTGIAIGLAIQIRNMTVQGEAVAMNNALININPTANAVVVPQGHPGYVIQNLDTGEIYMSQNQAAKALGISATILSQHLNGKVDDVSGMKFNRLGVAQHSQE